MEEASNRQTLLRPLIWGFWCARRRSFCTLSMIMMSSVSQYHTTNLKSDPSKMFSWSTLQLIFWHACTSLWVVAVHLHLPHESLDHWLEQKTIHSYLACLITNHHISRLLCLIDFDKSCNRFWCVPVVLYELLAMQCICFCVSICFSILFVLLHYHSSTWHDKIAPVRLPPVARLSLNK